MLNHNLNARHNPAPVVRNHKELRSLNRSHYVYGVVDYVLDSGEAVTVYGLFAGGQNPELMGEFSSLKALGQAYRFVLAAGS